MSSRSIVFTLLGMLLLSACQRTDLDLPVPEFTVGQALSTTATFDSLQMDQWLQQVCSWPHRRVGSTNWQSAMSEIETIFQQLGYTELQKDFFDIQYWECTNRSLSIQLDGESYAMPAFFDAYCGFTPPEGLTAELVYVGQQVEDDENLTGKIAVVDMTFSSNSATGLPNPVVRPNHLSFPENSALSGGDAYWQAKQAGALGVIFILADFHENISDYLYIPHEDMIRSLPALFVGNRDGIKLRCFAQEGRTANLMVEGIFETRQVYNLWTSLPGQSTENLIISTHGDAPFRGVIEDGSGLVSVFSQAQAWMAEPLENRPKTLHFVITAGHLYKDSPGGVVFSSLHPSIINETAALVEIEHLGAIDQRVENDAFIHTANLSNVGIYHSDGGYLEAELLNMLANYPISGGPVNLINTTFPLTEAAGWLASTPDLNYVSFVTNPVYLLTIGDDFDKLNLSSLWQSNQSIFQLSRNYADNL